MGFENLYGIEINKGSVEASKLKTKNINIIQGSVFDIPFKDSYFDLVYTSGVLIHIAPKDLKEAMQEIYRCTKKYIWGFEFYNQKHVEIIYRGNSNLHWKGDFVKLYIESLPGVELVKEKKLNYLFNENIDEMFLLKKK
jgi:pseudaminic acid biosynthesis-associated methylase